MAKISTLKEAINICRLANVTPFIWGHRGLGKSSLVRQEAADNRMGFIDFRCSQIEASDVRGLPDRGEDGRTRYLPPSDMPFGDMTNSQIETELAKVLNIKPGSDTTAIAKAITDSDINVKRLYYQRLQELQPHFQHGFLFLDEVNRAQDDVQQAIFQLVLDRTIGQYVLPPGWAVIAAGNYMEGYRVGGFTDPAFLNRFCHLDISGGDLTIEEWVEYMATNFGTDATEVIEFASHNVKHLDGEIAGERGFTVQPSRRSWEMVTRVLNVCKENSFSETAKTEVLAGLVGRELALSFSRYSCPVKPRELLANGVNIHKAKLKTLNRNQLTGLMWGLVSLAKSTIDDDKTGETCLDFADYMLNHADDNDIIVAFCRALVAGGGKIEDNQERARAAVISNPRLAQTIAKFSKAKGPAAKKTFIDRLVSRPALQKVLSDASWGTSGDGADD